MTTRRIPIAATLAGSLLALTLIAPWALGPDPAADLRRQAEQGDASAQFNLGPMYATGRGVPQDEAEAVRLSRLAAAQGLAAGPANRESAEGRGILRGEAEAVRLSRLAAAQGLAAEPANRGSAEGRGVVLRGEAEAVRRYRILP